MVWALFLFDYDISTQENLKEFANKIDFRVYDPIKESIGTILEGKVDKLLAKDARHYLQSDLLRLLALHKYGGIWIDMDILLLRDFRPILDQEYLYQWGGDTNFERDGACATVISLKKKVSFLFDYLSKYFINRLLMIQPFGVRICLQLFIEKLNIKFFHQHFLILNG